MLNLNKFNERLKLGEFTNFMFFTYFVFFYFLILTEFIKKVKNKILILYN